MLVKKPRKNLLVARCQNPDHRTTLCFDWLRGTPRNQWGALVIPSIRIGGAIACMVVQNTAIAARTVITIKITFDNTNNIKRVGM